MGIRINCFSLILISSLVLVKFISTEDILGCGGFIKSHVNLDFSRVEVKLFTKQGSLKDKTDCSPSNGYYFLPLYDQGEYVLTIAPPPGWSFEPQSVKLNVDGTDLCSKGKDINFIFKGFGITGKVETAGHTKGPQGVLLQLISDKGGEVRETTTTEDGNFYFTPVFPGTYTVKASHPRWRLAQPSVTVKVTTGNTDLKSGSLTIAGYDVSGSVQYDGQPLSGVHLALFTDKGQKLTTNIEGCSNAPLTGFPKEKGTPLCHVTSGSDGSFSLPSLATGFYKLIPHYDRQGVQFDIQPAEIKFEVQHDSLKLDQLFELKGFSVSGRVLTGPGGRGVGEATVLVNGNEIGVTKKDGSYVLDNMKSGTYTLQVQAENLEFKDHTARITLENPNLPDIIAHSFKVCGHVVSPHVHTVSITQHGSTFHMETDSSQGTGEWCLFLKPGKYSAIVKVSDKERSDGLQFFPLSQNIEISNGPVSGITFSQLKATVSGEIKCLPGAPALCPSQTVTLKSMTSEGYHSGVETTAIATGGKYSFMNVLPGVYEATIVGDVFCWKANSILITVNTVTQQVQEFKQIGYAVNFQASHQTHVKYTLQGKDAKLSESFDLSPGFSTHCVPQSGNYQVTVSGCHVYAEPLLNFNTNDSPKPVVITAISHSHGFKVVSTESVNDLYVNVKTSKGENKVGPLRAQFVSDNRYQYVHTLQIREGEHVSVTPQSEILLFSPTSVDITGSSNCVDITAETFGRKGQIVEGRIVPAISGVIINVKGPGVSLTTETDQSGRYKFGPLDGSLKYTVTAEKESYVLTGPDASGNFNAHKLCEIIVKVVDKKDGKPLQGVLLSLSGGESYRKNLQTNAAGMITFSSLSPSEYYLRPLMKEYKFEPSSKMIKVTEGATVNVELSGNRVAFSAYGTVTSLSGEAVSQVLLEAVGQNKCSEYIEEATSENSGAFRIRGLQPNCEYIVRVKQGPGINQHVDRSTPAGITVKATNEDIGALRLIAFHPLSHMDVSAHIIAPNVEHYRSLKVKLCRDDAPNSPIHVAKLDTTGFRQGINPGIRIWFPRIPADNKSYFVQIESSLSQATHTYSTNAIYFSANTSFKHIRLEFNAKTKAIEQDLNQTSVLALPLIILVALAFFNQQKVVDLLNVLTSKMCSTITIAAAYSKPTSTVEYNYVDDNEIEQIVQNINAVKRKPKPKKI